MGFHHGLSGLNAASKNLDVVGHNIANSGTTGFKGSRTEFNEMVASAMGGCGCTNPGIGVSVAAISQQFTQGVITPTSNGLDMAINGDGFFVVNTGAGSAYTRSGNFQLDRDGYLVTVNGDKVQGWNSTTGAGGELSDLQFPSGKAIPANPTSTVNATLNLDARAKDASLENTPRATYGTSLEVYDSQGMATPMSMYFEKSAGNIWFMYDGINAADPVARLEFDATGQLSAVKTLGAPVMTGTAPNQTQVIGADGAPEYAVTGTSPNSLTMSIKPTNPNAIPGVNEVEPFDVTLNLSDVTQFGNAFSVAKLGQDGYAAGELTGVSVSSDGSLMASYSNGMTRGEGRVALARFTNTQGLAPAGNNNWTVTADAGTVALGVAGTGSFGAIVGSALEASNVDLTAELVNMMTAQRAYQANAQTIKTQDQVFSTLVNLR